MKKVRVGMLLLMAMAFVSCSSDDSKVEEVIVEELCPCILTEYKVTTLANGTPVDTVQTFQNDNYGTELPCGYDYSSPYIDSVTMFGYEYVTIKCNKE